MKQNIKTLKSKGDLTELVKNINNFNEKML